MEPSSYDLADPQTHLRALVRARGDLTGTISTWWFTGSIHGVVGDDVRLLCGFESASVLKLVPRPDDAFDLTLTELPFYLDPATGATLDRLTNPFNGVVCEPPGGATRMPSALLTSSGMAVPEITPVPLAIKSRMFPAVLDGDDVHLCDHSNASIAGGGDTAAFFADELATYQVSLQDLKNPALTSVPARAHLRVLMSPFAWLEMSDLGGHVLGQVTGRKVVSAADLPETVVTRALGSSTPGFLGDPASFLDRP